MSVLTRIQKQINAVKTKVDPLPKNIAWVLNERDFYSLVRLMDKEKPEQLRTDMRWGYVVVEGQLVVVDPRAPPV